jgi:hypothetical protein
MRSGRDGSIQSIYDFPGTPTVGWHGFAPGSCVTEDPIYTAMLRNDGDDLIGDLKAIEARGPGRLVAGKSWAKVAT